MLTSDPSVTLSGTASDANGLASIVYRINSGRFQAVRGREKWSIPLTVKTGDTKVTLYAIDNANNRSKPVTITITRS